MMAHTRTKTERAELGREWSFARVRETALADAVSSRAQTPLDPSQAEIRRQRQDCGRNRSGQDEFVVHHRETAKNELAESSGADCRCNGGESNRDHDRYPDARKNHTHRQRQLHLEQPLAIGKSHSPPSFDNEWIHPADSRVGVANDRQEGIESERQDCQPIGTGADPRHGQQETEERQTWNRLNDVRSSQYRLVPNRIVSAQYAQRYADQYREQGGDSDQPQVSECEFQNLFVVLEEVVNDIHGVPRFITESSPSPQACT